MKTGIFGGTFDPVHRGHLGLAEDAAEQAGLDKVILMPVAVQPFKQDKETASGDDRLRMLEIAASEYEHLTVSRDELDNKGVSYTYLTMRRLQKQNPDTRLYFICGSDSFLKIDSWMNAEELLTMYSFIVGCDRPGYEREKLNNAISRIRNRFGTEILQISNRQFDISSTQIREKLAAKESITDFVLPEVERYILDHNLYGA